MNYSLCFVLSFFCLHLQAGPQPKIINKKQIEKSDNVIRKNIHYSWMQQFVESIEDGRNHVEHYVAKNPKLLTKVDKVSGLTPLEIAVVADNECAVQSILAVARENDKKLAISMAIDKAKQAGNTNLTKILLFSCVDDEDISSFKK